MVTFPKMWIPVALTLVCTHLLVNGFEGEQWSRVQQLREQIEDSEAANIVRQGCLEPYVTVGDQCLFFATFAELSYQDARQMCHSLDGELAAVLTATRLKNIIDYINENGIAGHSFWLGGSDAAQEGVWLWTDGQRVPMGAPFWGFVKSDVLEPDCGAAENCLLLNADGFHYFRDSSCSLLMTPLCMYPQ
ncbi:hypothetical protein OTU49_017457 [Cherax quadricarinatus]|uniref:C-type lectin domain-containing protein n=1 Tax=Cherax quadricarinatus TaxID=27406 RepID=A0AAW0X133_CHEQU